MRKSLLFCLAAATSLALASPVLAQSDQTQSSQSPTTTSSTSSTSTMSTSTTKVAGTIVSSSDKQLVIDTPTGRQTFIVVSGTSDVPAGLTAGTQVTVEFQGSGDQRTVTRVSTGTSSSSSSSTSPYSSSSSSTSPSASSTSPYSSGSSSTSTTSPRSSTSGTYDSGTSTSSSQNSSTGTSTDRDKDMDRTGRRHDRRAGTTDNDEHAANNASASNNLPATASPAFLVGLLGLLSLGGSALLRVLRRLL